MSGVVDKAKTIVILSNEPWGDVWFVKHRYAHELAKNSHRVFFLDPPRRWRPSDFFSLSIRSERGEDNLKILSYKNNFPIVVFPLFFLTINDWLNSWKLKKYLGKGRVLFWQFDHCRFLKFYFFKNHQRIYHVADPYYQTPYDKFIASRANLIVCTSRKYLPFYEGYQAPKIHIPHVISDEEFDVDLVKVNEIRDQYGKFFIYTGLINDSTDFELVEGLLDRGIRVMFIGSLEVSDQERWRRIAERCIYLGIKPGSQLKNYIQASIGGLVLYQFVLVGTVRSPLKILGYLAQKKPVVSSFEPDIKNFEKFGIFSVRNSDDFIKTCDMILNGEVVSMEEAVNDYLMSNTYDGAAKTILEEVG